MKNTITGFFKVEDMGELNPLLHVLERLRADHPKNDEMLFHSGGPIGKTSRLSMIPMLDDLRVVFHQPENDTEPINRNPLIGELDLGHTPPVLLEFQVRSDAVWTTTRNESHVSLESALQSICELEVLGPVDPSSGLSPGGFVGVLGYDLGQWTSQIRLKNTPEQNEVLGVLWRTKGWIIHDRKEGSITTLGQSPMSAEEVRLCVKGITETMRFDDPSTLESENRENHKQKIMQIIESIKDGHVYQVNYGRNWRGELDQDPWDCFLNLTKANPAPYSAWMRSSDLGWTIVSASPEQLLSFRDGKITTSPIKGTAPRHALETEDERGKENLMESEKDLAEHMMLVDLEKHDLSSVCVPGSVKWGEFRIESHPNVHHLVSEVSGELEPSSCVTSAISSLFPGGSITGCPKAMSMAIINHLERIPRGAWTGSIGHIHKLNNLVELNILIRTLEVHEKAGIRTGRVMAGGGIVHSSNPELEAQEAEWKADAVLRAAWNVPASTSNDTLPSLAMSSRPLARQSETRPNIVRKEKSRKKKIILIDNMDSFTHNIRDAMVRLRCEVMIENGWSSHPDEDVAMWVSDVIDKHSPDGIVIGPGPSRPESYNRTTVIANMGINGELISGRGQIPLLGICLGHQAICLADGSNLIRSPNGPVHGSPVRIENDGTGLFSELAEEHSMMRYNSLVILDAGESMVPNAWEGGTGLIMGARHRYYPIHGVQFHPESAGSPDGMSIIENFLSLCD
tara:strand:- start:1367 stop:3583 length:2217 start_codon:yes stop_codon:yes gene_type:complete